MMTFKVVRRHLETSLLTSAVMRKPNEIIYKPQEITRPFPGTSLFAFVSLEAVVVFADGIGQIYLEGELERLEVWRSEATPGVVQMMLSPSTCQALKRYIHQGIAPDPSTVLRPRDDVVFAAELTLLEKVYSSPLSLRSILSDWP